MKTIWKQELVVEDEQSISVPRGAKLLCVQVQNEKPCLWFLCDPSQSLKDSKKVYIYGTGNPIYEDVINYHYLGTFQLLQGKFVGHVFYL